MNLENAILELEKDYEISIRIKCKHRNIPAVRVSRYKSSDDEIMVLHEWEGEMPKSCFQEVNDDLELLLFQAKIVGRILKDINEEEIITRTN